MKIWIALLIDAMLAAFIAFLSELTSEMAANFTKK